MRLLDTPPPPDDPGLFTDPIDGERYRRLIESPLWAVFQTALRAERDVLLAESCETAPNPNQALWTNRGAIQWISRWLQSGPTLMLHYLRQQERS